MIKSNHSVQKVPSLQKVTSVQSLTAKQENLPTIEEPKEAVIAEAIKSPKEKTRRMTAPAETSKPSKSSLADYEQVKPIKWVEKVPVFTEQFSWSYFQHGVKTKPRRSSVGTFTSSGTFRPPSKNSRLVLPTLVKDNSLNFSGVFKQENQKHRRHRNTLMRFLEAL